MHKKFGSESGVDEALRQRTGPVKGLSKWDRLTSGLSSRVKGDI